MEWIIVICLTGLVVAFLVLLFFGLRQVQQQERVVVELWGKYWRTLRPGLQWVLPVVTKARAVVSVWEQTISLFESPIQIDFKDGSAAPQGTVVFIRIKSPDTKYQSADSKNETGVFRAIYEIDNWRTAVRDLIENALRSYLSSLTIDEAIAEAKGGYDLATSDPNAGLPNNEISRIKETLSGWGFELMRITITDFDLEPDLVKARGAVQIRRRAAEAASYEAVIRARETTGTLIAMMAEFMGLTAGQVRQRVAADPALRVRLQAVAEELVSRQVSIAGNALTDVRVTGGGDLERSLIGVIAAIKKA